MEASTTIQRMINGSKIFVPAYQRAYSWETPREQSNRRTHTDVFLSDLEEYRKVDAASPYYFGHFLFEEKGDTLFHVIDGQQRLTTIVIFLSALFKKLKSLQSLSVIQRRYFEDMVMMDNDVCFSTVDYDNQLFMDYVINQTKEDGNGIETESARRIVYAFDYFVEYLADKDEQYLTRMLEIIAKASCTTHIVKNESEAIQMYLFQNNRGKKPSNLEVIKAQFMYNVHLHGGKESKSLLKEVTNRFEKIYKAISSIDYKIDEDEVLVYTFRVYFNSLAELNPLEKINKELSDGNAIYFIKKFAQELSVSFEKLVTFFCKDEPHNYAIHSLVTLGGISIAYPFIIKAYKFGLDTDTIGKLCTSLESLILRHRLVHTRAEINTRINDVFKEFTETKKSIQPIIDHVNMIKGTSDIGWAYWNNTELERAIQGQLNPPVAKFLLWKYENHLEGQEKFAYSYEPTRYDKIKSPELEHIAPITESKKPHGWNEELCGEYRTGYDKYDEEFEKQCLHCLGNYLLVSGSQNSSMGNHPFSEKHKDYTILAQQREIRKLVPENVTWGKIVIQERKQKIIKFIMDNF